MCLFLILLIVTVSVVLFLGYLPTYIHTIQKRYVIDYGLYTVYNRPYKRPKTLLVIYPSYPNDFYVLFEETILNESLATFKLALIAKLITHNTAIKIDVTKFHKYRGL